ncbi:unnamed protein product [Phytophthora lilii]|uniref:Unnamed protein product n=1 Tax=Phytophthora lilii TaxID=2077276 RepID=A0A9W6TUA5_9STRA|nr:unnamed protein product [Phytophthora lilii]
MQVVCSILVEKARLPPACSTTGAFTLGGTLSPLDTTVKELGIDFPVRLENNHVVDADQVWVGVVGSGVTGKRLNSSYNFRSTETYLLELGNTIVNFTRLVPHGLLVFFPSYSILEESIDKWKRPATGESSLSIWDRIVQQKQTFVEPRGRADFKAVVDEYHQAIADNPKGAVFFAVCRGKKLTGNAWYIQQASRAVNQAIGRVIRHRHDYGAIILLDERFALKQQQECLSKWLQPYCHTCRGYGSYGFSKHFGFELLHKCLTMYGIFAGEAHIGLTRFFKGNKARAVPKTSVKKVLQQPKSIGISKRGLSKMSKASSDSDTDQANQQPSGLGSNSQTAIGDGQSYPRRGVPPPPMVSRPVVQQKRSLGSLLMSTSKSAMVDSTSSISRPFTAPKVLGSGGISDSAIVIDDEDAQSWQIAKQQYAAKQEPGAVLKEHVPSEKTFVTEFPAVARKVLQPLDVPKLYGFIRQLHAGEDVDLALNGICDLLRDPACKELLDLMPKVLNGAMCDRFIEAAKNRGLDISVPGSTEGNSARAQPNDMSKFFERLQQKRRKTHHIHVPTAAVVKDPQCFVCYDITRKAYASPQCGHICCHPCWKKVINDRWDVRDWEVGVN